MENISINPETSAPLQKEKPDEILGDENSQSNPVND
jgi:hypothetical protein